MLFPCGKNAYFVGHFKGQFIVLKANFIKKFQAWLAKPCLGLIILNI